MKDFKKPSARLVLRKYIPHFDEDKVILILAENGKSLTIYGNQLSNDLDADIYLIEYVNDTPFVAHWKCPNLISALDAYQDMKLGNRATEFILRKFHDYLRNLKVHGSL